MLDLVHILTIFSGYGNIAPKTHWGRVVTILYAMVGMPLFLVWASQMGSLLAQTFQFFYANVCCALCRHGKRRKATALAAKAKRQEEKDKAMVMANTEEGASNYAPESIDENILNNHLEQRPSITELGAVKMLVATPLHINHNVVNSDSGVQSQQSLEPNGGQNNKSIKIEILQPEIKELLSTCAQYNLDNIVAGKAAGEVEGRSAEVLEEIRHAEAIEIIRTKKLAEAMSVPASPLKGRPLVAKDDGSLYENNSSPDKEINTPMPIRKARLGHSTVVSVDTNGSPVTTLLKARPSREASPATSNRARYDRGATFDRGASRIDLQPPAASIVTSADSPRQQDKVPVMPVLVFIFAYFTLGATIFSNWEEWTFLEGFYFSFITLTTIGFGDFVPGAAVLSAGTEEGQAKLIIACIYVLMGLAVLSMAINLMQETIMNKCKELAIELGILDDPDVQDDDD
jgi:hypothetical protein